ncbi:Carbamoyl-phosphate synthase large chain [Dirofilaria immitis]
MQIRKNKITKYANRVPTVATATSSKTMEKQWTYCDMKTQRFCDFIRERPTTTQGPAVASVLIPKTTFESALNEAKYFSEYKNSIFKPAKKNLDRRKSESATKSSMWTKYSTINCRSRHMPLGCHLMEHLAFPRHPN